ncbi:hypothetical protein C8R48DRAFT_774579 [Suillus tomentosus]|nr:hypothetical protein C8R48DRAFT_774579 [Suillus tomentosus]
MYKQAGMRVFVLAARKTEEGKLLVTGHDYNDEFGGAESFTKTCDWQVILPEWEPYVTKLFNGDGEDDCVVHKAGRKDNTYMLDIGDSGVPVPPNYDEMDSGTRKMLPRKYLPDGTKIWEPLRMNREEATALLEFCGWWCKDRVKPPVRVVESDTEEESTVRSSTAKKTKKSTKKSFREKNRSHQMDDNSTGSADDDRPVQKVSQRRVQVRKTHDVVEESWEDSEADSNDDEPHRLPAKVKPKEKWLMHHVSAAHKKLQHEDSSKDSEVEEPKEKVKPPAKKPQVLENQQAKQNPACKIGPASRTGETLRQAHIQQSGDKEGTSVILPNTTESASAPAPSGQRPAPVPTLNKPGPNKKRARAEPDPMDAGDASPVKHTRSQTKKPAPAKRTRKATRH